MSIYKSSVLDDRLLEIPHFRRYPAMLPFIGESYESPEHAKLLLIGESGFFPEDSTIHKDHEAWYGGEQAQLSSTEVGYINCRNLLDNLGHKMYQELARCLGELSMVNVERPLSNAAYCNAFFRPAEDPGETFAHCSTPLDCGKSHEITEMVINILKPDVVVYVSKYAWNSSGQFVSKKFPEIHFDCTAHPTSPFHWNVDSYPDGKKKFIEILKKHFIRPSVKEAK